MFKGKKLPKITPKNNKKQTNKKPTTNPRRQHVEFVGSKEVLDDSGCRGFGVVMLINDTMAVTTLRQMSHIEIDDSIKSELLGALCGSPNVICLARLGD